MGSDSDGLRVLTPFERGLAVAVGAFMLLLSLLSIGVMVALATPVVRLVEGLSK